MSIHQHLTRTYLKTSRSLSGIRPPWMAEVQILQEQKSAMPSVA